MAAPPKKTPEDADSRKVEMDINRLLIPHPAATFLFRFSGRDDARLDVGPGDLLVVDRDENPPGSSLLLVECDDEWALCPGEDFAAFASTIRSWGVVSWILHRP